MFLFEVVGIDDDDDDDGVAAVAVVDGNVLFVPPLYIADEDADCTTGVTLRTLILALLP